MSNNYFKKRPSTIVTKGDVTNTQGNTFLDSSTNLQSLKKKTPLLIVD